LGVSFRLRPSRLDHLKTESIAEDAEESEGEGGARAVRSYDPTDSDDTPGGISR
jgi:hypothetical protein